MAGLSECGYRAMPRVEQTLLSPGVASSLKAPVLPSKPLCTTSALVGKGYTLCTYQADLLKELDEGEQVSSNDILELRRTNDFALRATKETARAIGQSMAALVASSRACWAGAAPTVYQLLIEGDSKAEHCLSCSPAAGPRSTTL